MATISTAGFDDEDFDFVENGNLTFAISDLDIGTRTDVWADNYTVDASVPLSIRLLAMVLKTEFVTSLGVFDAKEECYDMSNSVKWAYFNECVAIVNATRDMSKVETKLPAGLIRDFEQYNITAGMTDLADNIVAAVPRAYGSACDSLSCDKAGNSCDRSNLFINGTTLSQQGSFLCQQDLCTRVKSMMTIDQDIGGVGVFASYIIQTLIGLIIAVYIIAKWIMRAIRQRRELIPQNASVLCSRAWISFLITFQKTQCWFVSALVVAAFIRTSGNDVSDLDTSLLLLLSLNGIVLVSFTLLAVTYLGGPRSWFNFSLSVLAYILSSAFLEIAVSRRISKISNLWDGSIFCSDSILDLPRFKQINKFLENVQDVPDGIFVTCNVFCTLVMIVLFIRQAGWSYAATPEKAGKFWWRHRKLMGCINVAIIGSIYAGILSLGSYLLWLYFKIINKRDWGFGQIVAFTVWVPLAADFIQERWWEKDSNRRVRHRSWRAPSVVETTNAPIETTNSEYYHHDHQNNNFLTVAETRRSHEKQSNASAEEVYDREYENHPPERNSYQLDSLELEGIGRARSSSIMDDSLPYERRRWSKDHGRGVLNEL